MNTKIFYFSGTGNSLKAAQMISRYLKGELYSVNNTQERLEGVIGFVFPVQHLEIPRVISKAISSMDFSKVSYLFAAVTSGGDAGNALYSFNRLCESKGKRLDYGLEVKLGDNSIALVTKPEILAKRFAQLENVTFQLAEAVKRGDSNTHALHFQLKSWLTAIITRTALNKYYRIDKKSVIEEQCIHCGLCTKICPAGNIQMRNNKIEWLNQCMDCFACINWCPEKAIRFGKLAIGHKKQYRSTGITSKDIMQQEKSNKLTT